MDPYSREGVKKFRISTKSKREHYFMLGVFKFFFFHMSHAHLCFYHVMNLINKYIFGWGLVHNERHERDRRETRDKQEKKGHERERHKREK